MDVFGLTTVTSSSKGTGPTQTPRRRQGYEDSEEGTGYKFELDLAGMARAGARALIPTLLLDATRQGCNHLAQLLDNARHDICDASLTSL